jgi:NADH-quinone oxidoreductase subunit L
LTLEEIELYQSNAFTTCLFLALALPLISSLLSVFIFEKYSWIVSFSAPFLLLLSTLCAGVVSYWVWNHPPFVASWVWFSFAGFNLHAGILLNDLSALMLMLVTFISFLVNFYSTGYMAGDPDIKRYFAMLGFFTFSMLGIVVADNLLMIFIFWELVGFSSYMLIGHWKEKPEAADAAKRSFILNRVGDAGFLIGLMILWTNTGSFNMLEIGSSSSASLWYNAASLCIFCGVIGKSAQFPLFTWLPDAMEGPTPVSALIHAATMVAAGVFLLARVHFLFTPYTLDIVAVTGCLTALLGALAALVQYDIKKILAYSTVSQLGLMVMAIGAGSPDAAMLHLFTHAFFKAGLFLAAGSVIHTLHQAQHRSHADFNVQDIRNLGGLQKKLPFTFMIFLLSGSALAGIPFFSGFLSKDAILTSLMVWKGAAFSWRWLVFLSAFAVSFITVLYTFRMIWAVFGGEEKLTKDLHVLESPLAMRAPMAILAAASPWILVSWNPFNFHGWIYTALHTSMYFHVGFISAFSAFWVLLALGIAYVSRGKAIQSPLLFQAFYINKLYKIAFEIPVFQVAQLTAHTDKKWIDGFLHTAAYLQLIAAHIAGWFDRAIIDGIVDGTARLARGIGSFTRSFQRGKIQLYIFWAVFAIIIFIIWTLL